MTTEPAKPAENEPIKPTTAAILERELKDHEVPEVVDFLRENGVSVLLGGGLAVAVFLGFSAWKNYKETSAVKAEAQLFQSQSPEQIQAVIDQYPSTPAAPLAYVALASRNFDMGQYELSENLFSQFISLYPKHALLPTAELGIAQCKEASGRFEEAVAAFEAVIAKHEGHYTQPLALFGKARALEQLGRFDEAKAVYEDFVAGNPKSPWTDRAEAAILYVEKARRAAQTVQR